MKFLVSLFPQILTQQVPWILSGTVCNNILFGKSYDPLKGIMPSTLGVFYASILILLKPRVFSSAQRDLELYKYVLNQNN